MTTTTCTSCGTAAATDAAFCESCGSRLPEPAATSAASTSTSPPPSDGPQAANSGSSWGLNDVAQRLPRQPHTARSKAWIYYAILAILSLFSVFAGHAVGLVGVLLFGGYSTYIYRGGRIIFWFW